MMLQQDTHIIWRVEYSVPEKNGAQGLWLTLWTALRLAKVERRIVVVIYIDVHVSRDNIL